MGALFLLVGGVIFLKHKKYIKREVRTSYVKLNMISRSEKQELETCMMY
ncbi:hypothetical protein AAHB57_30115 [Bacillus cereus]